MSTETLAARGLFVTGTDTGVGKTVVASGLVRLLAQSGRRVAGLKPIASGAVRTTDGLRNEDALALAAESAVELPYQQVNPWCFEPAIAPHLAAREAGVVVTPADLVEWYGQVSRGLELAIGFSPATRRPDCASSRTRPDATTVLPTPVSVPVMNRPRAAAASVLMRLTH